MRLLPLITTIFLISNTVSALATCTTFSVTASPGVVTVGATVTLTAALSGCSATVKEVDFYNLGNELGSSTSPYTGGTCPTGNTCFSYSWVSNVTAPTGFSIYAVAFGSSGSGPGGTDMVIDTVGSSAPNPPPTNSPSPIQSFGEQAFSVPANGAATWLEGDNQICSASWPYNGYNVAYPDGSCEWMDQANVNHVTNKPVSTTGPGSSIDGLDEAMHTLSDFSKFSNSILSIEGGAVTATFNNWYPQAAAWIAPACKGTPDYCTSQGFDQLTCPVAVSCNQGDTDGRLLNLYSPPLTGSTVPQKDLFGDWNKNIITPWLNNVYTGANAWCVPSSATLAASSPTEYAYIEANSSPTSCAGGAVCPASGQCADGTACWGNLSNVIACLNYNAAPSSAGFGAASAFQNCLNQLPQDAAACPAVEPAACTALGRSLVACANGDTCGSTTPGKCGTTSFSCGYTPAYGTGGCVVSTSGSYVKWVKDNLSLFTDEANKFSLRSAYLTDVYTRAINMQNTFAQAHTALANFFKTCDGCSDGSSCVGATAPSAAVAGTCSVSHKSCNTPSDCPIGDTCNGYVAATAGTAGACTDGSACGGPNCEDGGPATQLIYARTKLETSADPLRVLPNAVIYGWTDKPYPNGHQGYAHIVKVVAFSPGRGGVVQIANNGTGLIQPLLPWINTWETWALRKFALASRDGYVYVDVRRWDEDHAGTLTFPNNHTLWQFLFHAPGTLPSITGTQLLGDCNVTINGTKVSYGLLPQTMTGLNAAMTPPVGDVSDTDTVLALQNAFMLNDEGDGAIDPTVKANGNGMACTSSGGTTPYCSCLQDANQLIGYGVESRACAEYIASGPGDSQAIQSGSSHNGDSDYSLKFVDCKTLPYANNALSLDDLVSASD